jgi:DNA invertase Pin-like site-specific DNA recombinase
LLRAWTSLGGHSEGEQIPQRSLVIPHGRLVLTVLGGLAEFERRLIAARTSEGPKRARANGVLFGRSRKLTPH